MLPRAPTHCKFGAGGGWLPTLKVSGDPSDDKLHDATTVCLEEFREREQRKVNIIVTIRNCYCIPTIPFPVQYWH